MRPDRLDDHLNGRLGAAERAEMERLVRDSPEAADELALRALDRVLLGEVVQELSLARLRGDVAAASAALARQERGRRRPELGAGRRRRRRAFRLYAALAGAAVVLGAVTGVLARRGGREVYRLTAGGRPVERGATVTARDEPVQVELGGYCSVTLRPGAVVRVGGREKAEEIHLDRGSTVCEVDRGSGDFAVRTEAGTASVRGTRFEVEFGADGEDRDGGPGMKRMLVRVLAGAVLVAGPAGEAVVYAQESASLPAERRPSGGGSDRVVLLDGTTIRGTVTEETDATVSIRTPSGMSLTVSLDRVRSIRTAAGERVVNPPDESAVPVRTTGHRPGTAAEIRYPADANIVDVRDHGVRGDGMTDDTAALQALFDKHSGVVSWAHDRATIYLPEGIYLVSRDVLFHSLVTVQGQSERGVVIRLKDNSPLFQNPAKPVPVVRMHPDRPKTNLNMIFGTYLMNQ
jgi:hypothetical protein